MRVPRDGQLPGGRTQGVTVPGRHRQPPLGIETERGRTLEHVSEPLKGSFHHLIALFPTVSGNRSQTSGFSDFLLLNQPLSAASGDSQPGKFKQKQALTKGSAGEA
ncbi:MAG: hypothetical protein ACKOXQ_01330 [Hydrogenophaga sp.]